MKSIEKRLTGGHPNSLGNTIEIVEEVLENNELFDELFHCYFSNDELVRLRVSNAMKRICKVRQDLLVPYLGRFLCEIAVIDQPSTQWTLAQLFDMMKEELNDEQVDQAKSIMKNNLEHHTDWIVLNTVMDVLGRWSKQDNSLNVWLIPHLERLSSDPRKSVSKRAKKLLATYKM